MQAKEARQIPITSILDKLGYQPVSQHKGGQQLRYPNPFREERTPSFDVNVLDNTFYDFGTGQGGKGAIDFTMQLIGTKDLAKALSWLREGNYSSYKPASLPLFEQAGNTSQIEINAVKPMTRTSLKNYLRDERKLDTSLTNQFVQEVHYMNGQKGPFFAIGFANDSEGYELRTKGFKGSSGKDITYLAAHPDQPAKRVQVFEGFMDFLSFITLTGVRTLKDDVLVLNGTAMAERASAKLKMGNYDKIFTWMDQGVGAERVTQQLMQEFPQKIISMNGLYEGYKDLNAYLVAERSAKPLDDVRQHFRDRARNYAPRSPYELAERHPTKELIR